MGTDKPDRQMGILELALVAIGKSHGRSTDADKRSPYLKMYLYILARIAKQ
jgi:hypothetical protein